MLATIAATLETFLFPSLDVFVADDLSDKKAIVISGRSVMLPANESLH